MAYDQFASKVAEHLKTDPNHLRFTTVSTAGKPKQAIKYNANSTLNNILFPGPYNYSASAMQRNDALFYEVLDMSLKELEQRKPVKVTWLPDGLSKEEEHTLMVPKNAQVSDLLEALQKKAGISDEIMQKTRAYEAHMHKFHKVLPPDHSIMSLYDYTQIFVAPYPDDESSKKITVFHYDKEPSKPHGVPFQFSIKEGEPFSETKQRLSDFTKIKGKQLDKIKFALVSRSQYSKPEPLDDDDVLWDIIAGRDDVSLGLDHPAKTRTLWGKTDSIFIR